MIESVKDCSATLLRLNTPSRGDSQEGCIDLAGSTPPKMGRPFLRTLHWLLAALEVLLAG